MKIKLYRLLNEQLLFGLFMYICFGEKL